AATAAAQPLFSGAGSDFFPARRFGGLEDGIADVLRFKGVAKSRAGRFAGGDALKEISDLVDKGVLIADLEAGKPPFGHVRMVTVGDVKGTPATNTAFVAMIEILQAMQIVEVPEEGSMLAVDFEGIESLVSAGIASRFERRQRAVAEPGQERARIVDPHF